MQPPYPSPDPTGYEPGYDIPALPGWPVAVFDQTPGNPNEAAVRHRAGVPSSQSAGWGSER